MPMPKNEVSSNFVKWEKVGQEVCGTLVAKSDPRPNTLKEGTNQVVYTIVTDEGEELHVAGRILCEKNGELPCARFPQVDKLKLGAYIGFRFAEETPNSQPGYNATKKIKVLHDGEMKPEVLKEYLGVGAAPQTEMPEM